MMRLAFLAKESGAEYLVNSYVENIENTVTIRNGSTYTAKVIVGAGGHNDLIRRKYCKKNRSTYLSNLNLKMAIMAMQ